MILADTAIWIGHWRQFDHTLETLVGRGQIICHPIVIGELACGQFPHRKLVLQSMRNLPQTMQAEHDEVLTLIEHHKLMGIGIGYADAHLLASCLLGEDQLWTIDQRLHEAARRLRVHAHF